MERPGPVLPLAERALGCFRYSVAIEKLGGMGGEALPGDAIAAQRFAPHATAFLDRYRRGKPA